MRRLRRSFAASSLTSDAGPSRFSWRQTGGGAFLSGGERKDRGAVDDRGRHRRPPGRPNDNGVEEVSGQTLAFFGYLAEAVTAKLPFRHVPNRTNFPFRATT